MPNAITFPFWYLNSYVAIMCFVSICASLFIDNCCDGNITGDCLLSFALALALMHRN